MTRLICLGQIGLFLFSFRFVAVAAKRKKVKSAQYCVTETDPYTSTVPVSAPCLASDFLLFVLIGDIVFIVCKSSFDNA